MKKGGKEQQQADKGTQYLRKLKNIVFDPFY